MTGADAARSLISIGNAVEFDADFACRKALNRQFDVEKAKRGVVIRVLLIEIERADFPVRARTQFAVAGHLRIGPRRGPRGQWPQRAELSIRIALTHRFLPDFPVVARLSPRSIWRRAPDSRSVRYSQQTSPG